METHVVERSTAVGEGDDLDRSIRSLGHVDAVGLQAGQAEDAAAGDTDGGLLDEGDVEGDGADTGGAAEGEVEEGVDVVVGVVVGDGAAVEGPEGAGGAIGGVKAGAWKIVSILELGLELELDIRGQKRTRIDPLRGGCAEGVSSGLGVEKGEVSRGGGGQSQDGGESVEHFD